jgi:hypothetical protein
VLAKGWDSDLRIHHMFFRFPPLLLATYDLRLENNAMLYAGYPRALRLTPCALRQGIYPMRYLSSVVPQDGT